jgi:hypothetical protein
VRMSQGGLTAPFQGEAPHRGNSYRLKDSLKAGLVRAEEFMTILILTMLSGACSGA